MKDGSDCDGSVIDDLFFYNDNDNDVLYLGNATPPKVATLLIAKLVIYCILGIV